MDAATADLTFDISALKPEDGLFLSSLFETQSISITVSPDQDKGTYRLFGDAAEFTGTISVKTESCFIFGELTLENNTLDYDITRYTLSLNEANEVCVTVSSNIPDTSDYVLLYKDGELVATAKSVDGITISSEGQYDKVAVLKSGVLTNSTLDEGGHLVIYSGARVTGLTDNSGNYNLSLIAGDGTVFNGTNEFGTFSYENGYAENLSVGLNGIVNVYQDTELHNVYLKADRFNYGANTVNIYEGGTVSGTYYNGFVSAIYLQEGAIGKNMKGEVFDVFSSGWIGVNGASVYDSELFGVEYLADAYIENTMFTFHLSYENIQITGPVVFKDVTISGPGSVLNGGDRITLAGDLTLGSSINTFDAGVDAAGNTITIDLTGRNINSGAFVNFSKISEDAKYRLNVKTIQKFGRYQFGYEVGSFIDSFSVYCGDEYIGTLSATNESVTNGDWTYTLIYDQDQQTYSLDVGVSDSVSDDKKVWYWDSAGDAHWCASLDGITIGSDACKTIYVLNGGVLTNSTLDEGGHLVIYSGARVTGLTDNSGNYNLSLIAGDGTVFNGTNEFGTFSYENGYAENLSVGLNGIVNVYQDTELHNVYLKADRFNYGANTVNIYEGGTVSGTYYNGFVSAIYLQEGAIGKNMKGEVFDVFSSGWIGVNGASVYDSELFGVEYLADAYIENTMFTFHLSYENIQITGPVVFKDVTISGPGSVLNGGDRITLAGDLTLGSSINTFDAGVDAAGNTITIDLTGRNINSGAFVNVGKIHNAKFYLQLAHDQFVGSYAIAYNASNFGQGDAKGIYNWDTNTWDFNGEVIGDMDGVIEIRDENRILLANCTVNGDTEYFGRYNYTVRVDDSGDMYLDVGWNTREGRTYAADGYDNLTLATAAMLPEAGTKLTIDSADDVDWFQFTLDTVGRKSSYIGIEFKQWAGDLDLYLYGANGIQLDYAKSVTDNERISLKGLSAGDYYVKVEGYEGNVNEYKLVYSLPEPVVLTDEYENGDTKAHSYHLGKLSEQITLNAAISRTDDLDYYMFQLPKKGLTCDTITLTYDEDFGDLDLYLYGSNGKDEMLLAQSLSTSGGTARISLAGLKHGVYYVAVKSKDGSVGNYQLAFDVNAHEVNPDKYENNNSLKKATNLYTLNGNQSLAGLSIHQNESKNDKEADPDVDYYKFSILEKGSADDWIGISYEVSFGDLDIEILNADGEVVAFSRTAENEDTVSLKGFEVGDYYIRVSGYNNVANNYTLNWNVTNSSLIPSDSYEGMEPIAIRENQTITGLSIAKPVKEDETRADTFKIVLEYDAWKRSKIILTDYRSDWEDGMKYVIRDVNDNILKEGKDSEISLSGLKKGEYY